MALELLMNITPTEARIASVEDGVLLEFHLDRESKRGIVGNIYQGKVIRILPGMQAAFVDIGLEKAAFLHATNIMKNTECVSDIEQKKLQTKDISELIHDGQLLLVQVIKDPISTKGARLTTDITIPSRYLVFMPELAAPYVATSQRIESEKERTRLKNIVENIEGNNGGYIIRTAAEGVSEEILTQDAHFLNRVWKKIEQRIKRDKITNPIYSELVLSQRILRDFIGETIDKILVDSNLAYHQLLDFTQEFLPELTDRVVHYKGTQPIFDLYDIENEIQRSLESSVPLKSGGYLIIEQTEAMTTIDVNTGKFIGHRNLEETIFNTNIESAHAIARQLKLRNLGGIIIIDFIDMQEETHKERLITTLAELLSKDRMKTMIHIYSPLGLVEMTRKRTRESLANLLCEPCSACKGRGMVKSIETVCNEIMREIVRIDRVNHSECFVVYASSAVAEALTNDQSVALAELELFVEKQVKVSVEPLYKQEQYDVVLM